MSPFTARTGQKPSFKDVGPEVTSARAPYRNQRRDRCMLHRSLFLLKKRRLTEWDNMVCLT